MNTYYAKKLTCYTIGGAFAATVTSEGALVWVTPGGEGVLTGDSSEESVPRAVFSFQPGTGTLTYDRVVSSDRSTTGSMTISPDYEYKDDPVSAEARSALAYQSFVGSEGAIADGSQSYDTVTGLVAGNDNYLGLQYTNIIFQDFYGWVKYDYVGGDVTIDRIVFSTIADAPVIIGALPESSTVMAIAGGVLAGGLIGIRQMRKKKAKAA
ncbi:hypothetical protein [Cerasicoccus frondis]|uniref:hypothetical protein n=1 Tax=Cerasicoccus frondis TaxID=490090 RepID=UPI0028526D29|nr:hypothetical protein [Cerasicoccus frondis]